MKKLSQKLYYYFFEEERAETISLSHIFALTEERLFGFPLALIAFFGMFPIPGTSAIFGIAMLVITLQLFLGQTKPWVPQQFLQKTFTLSKIQSLMRRLIPWLQRIEKIAKPRLTPICHSLLGRIILGFVLSMSAVIVVLPIPAGNTIPSLGIFLAALGLQEDDGVLSLLGMIISVLFAGLLIGVAWTGGNLLLMMKEWLMSYF